jgi:hypothetical protein
MRKIAAALFTFWWTTTYLKIHKKLPLFIRRRKAVLRLTDRVYFKRDCAASSRAMFRWAALNLAATMQGSDLKKIVAFLMDVNKFGRCNHRRITHEHAGWGWMRYEYDDCRREEKITIIREYQPRRGQYKKVWFSARDMFGL